MTHRADDAEPIFVWGAGGHGRVVADLVRTSGRALGGFIDADAAKLGREVEPGGGRVVILERDFLGGSHDGLSIRRVAFGIGDNAVRLACLASIDGLGAPALVHRSAIVSPFARIGRGAVVLAGSIVNAGAEVGDAAIVNTGAIVEHDCRLETACHVSPAAALGGGVRVGARAWIGLGARVVPGIEIGDDAIVGAGAVVIRDVPPGATVVGVPARERSRRETP